MRTPRAQIPLLDELLEVHATALGADAQRYRNHTYRVANLTAAFLLDSSDEDMPKVAVATALHDIGIWTHHTFAYLEPSMAVAASYLNATGRTAWTSEVTRMILEHHKLSSVRHAGSTLVEPFRRADWIDVSRGIISFGLPRAVRDEVFSIWPDLGFGGRLIQLTLRRLRTHPLSPLPMLRR